MASQVRILWALILLLGLGGCGSIATRKGFYEPITAEVRERNFDTAVVLLEQARENGKFDNKDRLLYFMDAGLLRHYSEQFDSSNQKLHVAEEAAEELFTKSISRAAASMVLNDNVLEYAGEDYELIYANVIKALNFIALGDIDGAFVEVRRANLRLDQLMDKHGDAAEALEAGARRDSTAFEIDYEVEDVRFHNLAFARYLSMHMYAADGLYDDARIDLNMLHEAFAKQPQVYDFPPPDVTYRADGNTILSIVALAGLGPTKEAWTLRLRTDSDLNLVQILYTDTDGNESEYGHLPVDIGEDFYFKFSIPRVVPRPSDIASVAAYIDGQPAGELQLLENVYRVAEETFAARKSVVYFKTIARALTKGLLAAKQKKNVDDGGLAGWLKKAAIDVVTDLSEAADIRSTNYLPGRVFVRDVALKPGTYDLRIDFLDINGGLVSSTTYKGYQVRERGLNMVEAFSLN